MLAGRKGWESREEFFVRAVTAHTARLGRERDR
jgi:hypothetical protein